MCNRFGTGACSALPAGKGLIRKRPLNYITNLLPTSTFSPSPSAIAMPKQTGFIAWYDRLISSFSIEDLFVRKRPPGPPRTIYINEPLPEEYYDKKHHVLREHQYASNQVITSKYTLITFLPRNLLEQYRRVANVYVTPSPHLLYAQIRADFSLSSPSSNSSPSSLPSLLAWSYFRWLSFWA